MNTLPIIAGSQVELDAYLAGNPWLNRQHVVRVTGPQHLMGRAGLVLAIPGWNLSPSIRDVRELLNSITARGMQLVVLEHAAYQLPAPSAPVCRDHLAELELAERFNRESG